jgi:hypothetical protein
LIATLQQHDVVGIVLVLDSTADQIEELDALAGRQALLGYIRLSLESLCLHLRKSSNSSGTVAGLGFAAFCSSVI